jgi:transposase
MQLQLYGKQIWVYRKPIDFRRSIDGLSAIVILEMKQNPQDGIYIFYNRHHDKLKCLSWHKNGFILLYKRLEKGRFYFKFNKIDGVIEMSPQELDWLFAGLPWQEMKNWRELDYEKFS